MDRQQKRKGERTDGRLRPWHLATIPLSAPKKVMGTMSTVPELDILVASILWLHDRSAKPLCASIAQGSEAGRYADHQRFREALQQAGLEPCSLAADGPDIIAASESECWQVRV